MTTVDRLLGPASGGWRRVHHWGVWCAIALVAFAVASPQAAQAANSRSQIEIQNHTIEPVRVFVAYRSISPNGQFGWFNTKDETTWVLQPGDRTLLVDRGFTVNADIIRIRARGEKTGRQWNWGQLFIGSFVRGASRVKGKKLFTIWTEEGLAQFSDRHTRRTIAVKNETKETLTVCVAYHAKAAKGAWGWQNTKCETPSTFKPGEKRTLRHEGSYVRANAIKVHARNASGDRVWVLDRDKALFVGDYEGTGGFQGTYTYTITEADGLRNAALTLQSVRLTPATVGSGHTVEVVMDYEVGGVLSRKERQVKEEQRIERAGKVVGRYTNTVLRQPGVYRTKRKVTIPLLADLGKYTVVGSVTAGKDSDSKRATLQVAEP